MKPNIKTLALLAAAACASLLAQAEEVNYTDATLTQLWKCTNVNEVPELVVQGYGVDDTFILHDWYNGNIIQYDRNGAPGTVLATTGEWFSPALSHDEAGNWIVRQREWDYPLQSTYPELLLIKADGSQSESITFPSDMVPYVSGNTMMYLGQAEGDVFSAEGGRLCFTGAKADGIYVAKFRNGQLVPDESYKAAYVKDSGIEDISYSTEAYINAWKAADGTTHYLYVQRQENPIDMTLDEVNRTFHGNAIDVERGTMPDNCHRGQSNGYNMFALGGKNYMVLPASPNWLDGFLVIEVKDDFSFEVLSHHVNDYPRTQQQYDYESLSSNWLNVEPINATSCYIYQYFPWGYLAKYKFEVSSTPLETIVNDGTVGESYTVADDIIGVYVAVKDPRRVYAKDLGKHRYPSTIGASQVDYVRGVARLQAKDWDQSNWVLLDMGNANDAEALIGKVIEGGTLTGTLTDKLNPTMTVTDWKQPTEEQAYDVNNYVTCNFMTPNVQAGNDGKNYFFVEPKAQEYAMVNWATYRGQDHFSVLRTTETGETFGNQSGLAGEFDVDWSLYPGKYWEDFVFNNTYNFHAIVRYIPAEEPGSSAPRRAATQGRYMVFPLEGGAGIVTAVDTPHADRTVASVTYVDALGRVARTPHTGVNIVVTRYTDGTQSVVKTIK